MSQHRVLQHRDYMRSAGDLPIGVRNKAEWAMLQLGARGRTPSTKSTVGHKMHWRRSPVQGSHFYLWWIPASDANLDLNGAVGGEPAILVHSIRHHDATNESIEVGNPSDYAPVDLGLLDPRFDEQREASVDADASLIAFSSIEGTPGSGKSVALLLLARDLATRPGIDRIRYITWSARLKNEAKELFASLGEELARHITVLTLNEVAKQLVDDKSLRLATFDSSLEDQRAFIDELAHMNPKQLGNWRFYPDTLYTELRAHVIGRDFPDGYAVPKHKDAALRRSGGVIDVRRYARDRGLDERSAEIAIAEGTRLRSRFFADQALALRALRTVLEKGASSWLAHTDAIIVDEVQDLTLLQIALIGEMANVRRRRHPEKPFVLTVAGDESQIVQPTGFEWGVTKNLLGEKLGVHPVRHEFRSQRRSPLMLSRLVEASWSLYGALPKELRPRAQQSVAQMEEGAEGVEEYGVVGFLPPPVDGIATEEWRGLLTSLASRPGRVIVDLDGSILDERDALSTIEGAGEVIFDPREIKGLERATVLVSGLQATYQRVQDLLTHEAGDRIAQMEARRLIDHMRVALSRSTNRMVFVDERSAPVFARLGIAEGDSALAFDLEGLVGLLDADEMTEVEMVDALLDEAADLDDRGRRDEGRKRNRRAADLAEQLRLPSLIARAAEQRTAFLLADAERALEAGDVAAASNHLAEVAASGDGETLAQRHPNYHELRQRVAAASHGEYGRLIALALEASEAERWPDAADHAEAAFSLAEGDEGDLRRREAGIFAKSAHIRFALELARDDRFEQLRPEIARAFVLSRHLGTEDAQHIYLLQYQYSAERDTDTGAIGDPETLLSALALGLRVDPSIEGEPSPEVQEFYRLWLDQAYARVGEDTALFKEWAQIALVASAQIGYTGVDDRIWDLENRWQLLREKSGNSESIRSFGAFLADYNGDFADASVQWEELGRFEDAATSARNAGDLERAYSLLTKKAKTPPPEDLATAVQLVRRIQAMHGKYSGLTVAEKRTVLEELARLHTEVTDSLAGDTLPIDEA